MLTEDGKPITFTIARSLIAQAAQENLAIRVTVHDRNRVLARLDGKPTTKKETTT